ncbi:hypothetical protein P7K49_026339, partial [Saguinus oedipus]
DPNFCCIAPRLIHIHIVLQGAVSSITKSLRKVPRKETTACSIKRGVSGDECPQ